MFKKISIILFLLSVVIVICSGYWGNAIWTFYILVAISSAYTFGCLVQLWDFSNKSNKKGY